MAAADTAAVRGGNEAEGVLRSDLRALAIESQVRTIARAELARLGQLARLEDVVAAALRRIPGGVGGPGR